MNIFETDTIAIRSKKQAAEHIVERYGNFGWKLTEKKDDRLYEDVTHMTFSRPHFIENRDELQLLQVRLEIAYNDMGKFSYKKGVRASLFGSFFALLALAFAAGGVLLLLFLDGLLPIIYASVLFAACLVTILVTVIFTRRISQKDRLKYGLKIEERLKKIEDICNQARALRGENG